MERFKNGVILLLRAAGMPDSLDSYDLLQAGMTLLKQTLNSPSSTVVLSCKTYNPFRQSTSKTAASLKPNNRLSIPSMTKEIEKYYLSSINKVVEEKATSPAGYFETGPHGHAREETSET